MTTILFWVAVLSNKKTTFILKPFLNYRPNRAHNIRRRISESGPFKKKIEPFEPNLNLSIAIPEKSF